MGTRPGEPLPLASGLLLSRYMAKAVWLQRVVEPDWVPTQKLHFPMCPSGSVTQSSLGLGLVTSPNLWLSTNQ